MALPGDLMLDRDYIERLEAAVILGASADDAPEEVLAMREEIRRARILRAEPSMDHAEAEQVLR